MRRVLALILLLVSAGITLPRAQDTAPGRAVFEVASIRAAAFANDSYFEGFARGAGNCGLWRFTPKGNRVELGTVTLCMIIRMAYEVTEFQVVGLPEWADQSKPSAWYRVEARAEPDIVLTLPQARERLQSLLADRFALRFHRESRRAPVYALVVDRGGHKLSTDATGCPDERFRLSFFVSPGSLTSCKAEMSISQIIIALNREVDRPVVDRTQLTGRYSFALKWSPNPLAGADAGPSIFTAVREQLGLRLEPTEELVEAIVIDRVEPPSAN
jgi:uncharacterized protein (TIGR03435 family)